MNSSLGVDVLVCGGGMAGSIAAIAAARAGADTLLVERYGFLGGSATAAAVGQFVGWQTAAGRQVVHGIAEELVQRLVAVGAAIPHSRFIMSTGHRMDRVQYDPELLKCVLDDMVDEAGARVLFHVTPTDVRRDGNTIGEVVLATKAGPLRILPKVVIDASGDLEIAALAKADFLGLESGEALQPATMMFRYGPMDFERFDALPADELAALASQGVEQKALARAALHCSRVPGSDEGWFNISRVAVDPADPFSLSAAEVEGRRQAVAASRFLRDNVPGCEAGRIRAIAPQLGIRESRRIHGIYVLTVEDLHDQIPFADTIAIGAYPVDVHPAAGTDLRFETFGPDHAYSIPYRSLVPLCLTNVLVAGRGISATHDAHAATRVMPLVMAIGQAAGQAAAMSAAGNVAIPDIPMKKLQDALTRADAYLGAAIPKLA